MTFSPQSLDSLEGRIKEEIEKAKILTCGCEGARACENCLLLAKLKGDRSRLARARLAYFDLVFLAERYGMGG